MEDSREATLRFDDVVVEDLAVDGEVILRIAVLLEFIEVECFCPTNEPVERMRRGSLRHSNGAFFP